MGINTRKKMQIMQNSFSEKKKNKNTMMKVMMKIGLLSKHLIKTLW